MFSVMLLQNWSQELNDSYPWWWVTKFYHCCKVIILSRDKNGFEISICSLFLKGGEKSLLEKKREKDRRKKKNRKKEQ